MQKKTQKTNPSMDQDLRDSELRYRRLFETAQDGILLLDAQTGAITDVNPYLIDLLGYTHDEFLEKKLWEVGAFKDIPASKEKFEALQENQYIRYEDLPLKTKDGRLIKVEFVSNVYQVGEQKVIQCNIRNITQSKLAEAELKKSEEKYRTLISQSPDGVFVIDLQGNFLSVNQAICDTLNYSVEEFLSMKIWDIVPAEFIDQHRKRMAKILMGERLNEPSEYLVRGKDGKYYTIEVVSVPYYQQKDIIGFQGMARNVTGRKQIEEALRASEERFKALFERSLDAVYLNDFEGRFIEANPAAVNLLGYSYEEILSLTYQDILASGNQVFRALANLKELQETGIQKELAEYRLKHKNGAIVWVEIQASLVYKNGKPFAILGIARDITKRRQAEQNLRASEERYHTIFAESPLGIATTGRDFRFLSTNAAFCSTLGYTEQELALLTFRDITHPEHVVQDVASVNKLLTGENPLYRTEKRYLRKDGGIVWAAATISVIRDEGGEFLHFLILVEDISERKSSEDQIRRSEQELKNAQAVAHVGSWNWDIKSNKLNGSPETLRIFGIEKDTFSGSLAEIINRSIHPDDRQKVKKTLISAAQGNKPEPLEFRIVLAGQTVRHLWAETGELFLDEQGAPASLTVIVQDISERKHAEQEIADRLAELEAVNKISTAMRAARTLDEMLPLLLNETLELLHAPLGTVWLYDAVRDELRPAALRSTGEQGNLGPRHREKPGEGIAGYVFSTGQPMVVRELCLEPRLPVVIRQEIPPGVGGAAIPIRAGDNVIGALTIYVTLPREISPAEVHLLTTLSEIAGNAIQRTTLHEQTERRLRRLTALSDIDRAISSNFDLRLNLGTLLDRVIDQLEVDAADVLLYNPTLHLLEYIAGTGFRTQAFDHTQLRLGEGYAGQAALDRCIISIHSLGDQTEDPSFTRALQGESFTNYYAVPLIAKGQIKGVLEIFQRDLLEPDSEWRDFLATLAEQAAIAIDVSTLFDNLERSNTELALAYDATIEGWSRALDLRDKETEGHTQRVTETTVRLARAFSLDEKELIQVRWGALLHDIGKMGIPDSILLKPSRLTEEEWVIMKKHPIYAYELLSPVRYLRLALDIPYCHHEKWDGTGYPRGLKGEQIPLTARIFAVVDVWDALRSDRPYRAAWPEEKVLAHIKSLAGSHFDPQVVKVFLESGMSA